MPHTVLRRRANGETDEEIQPHLLTPIGRHKGHSPSLSSTYRALTEYENGSGVPEGRRDGARRLRRPQRRDHSPT
ncbi:hypothetical protein [Streptomyces decoyicus]|uniref:hypothetical protein n=1 Tax=Streptomyces decoyicus TaxID=249567 RepID=UPI00386649CB